MSNAWKTGTATAAIVALILAVVVVRLSGEVEEQRQQLERMRSDAAQAVVALDEVKALESRVRESASELRELERQVARVQARSKRGPRSPERAGASQRGPELPEPQNEAYVAEPNAPMLQPGPQ